MFYTNKNLREIFHTTLSKMDYCDFAKSICHDGCIES